MSRPDIALNARRRGSTLGWALLLSLGAHAIVAPFFGLKALAHERPEPTEPATITIDRHTQPTPAPPTPVPRPPTPMPRQAVRSRDRPQRRIALHVARTTHAANATSAPAAPASGSHADREPQAGDLAGSPGPGIASAPATATPTAAPPNETPKPMCAKPNADAAVRGPAVEPDFPASARDRGESGTTIVRVTLAASGAVAGVAVQQSSGYAILDSEALKAARYSNYTAEIVDCAPTSGAYLFTADFDGQ